MKIKQHTPEQPMDQKRNQKGSKKYLEKNENESTTYQNLCDAEKAAIRRNYIVINAHITKKVRSQINKLTLHLKELEKEQTKPKVSKRKETIKIRVETNETETRKTIEKTNETMSWFFEKINKIDESLATLWKRSQINKIRNEKEDITTNTTEIKRIIRDYYEQFICQQIGWPRRNG